MKLQELFNKKRVGEEQQMMVAFLLADYGLLKNTNDDGEEEYIDKYDLCCFDIGELEISEYDLTSGCNHNGCWVSFEEIIKSIVSYFETYED